MGRSRVLACVGVVTACAAAGVACSSSSGSPAATPGDDSGNASSSSGGSSSSGSSSGAGTSSGSSSGSSSGGSSSGGADAGDAGASTLYGRLGGHAGTRGAIDAIVAQELMDPDIQSYFFNQVATPVPAGHPTADQIEECFTDLLGKAAGGPETYPTTVESLTDAGADAGTFACRADMVAIHQSLKISGGTFDKFVMIAGGVLTSAMGTGPYTFTTADIGTVAGVLVGTKPAIVDPAQADAGLQPFPGPDAQ